MVALLVAVSALLIGVYFGSTMAHTSDWLWLTAVAGGLVIVLLFTLLRRTSSQSLSRIVPLAVCAGLLIPILTLDRTLATYIGGIWLLAAILIIRLLHKSPTNSANPDSARGKSGGPKSSRIVMTVVMLSTALGLIVIPAPVSRVVLNLPGVAVPMHFALYADPETTPEKNAMYYQGIHQLSPLTVQLDTESNLPPGTDMPWLRFAVMRDSNVIVEQIRYQSQVGFYHVDVKTLRPRQLHQLELDPLSHEVRLTRQESGIIIDQIGFGEEAWLRLPGMEIQDIETVGQLWVIALRITIWIFICFTFLLWKPALCRSGQPSK